MKRTIQIIAMLILLSTSGVLAQANNSRRLSLSYLGGMITHPGVSLGYWTTLRAREGKNATVSEWRAGGNVGAYFHRDFQRALVVSPAAEWVRLKTRGGMFGAGISAGYVIAVLPSVYQQNAEGVFVPSKMAIHYGHLTPYLVFGRRVSLFSQEMEWFLKPQLMLRAPHVTGIEKYFLLQTGLNLKLK